MGMLGTALVEQGLERGIRSLAKFLNCEETFYKVLLQ